jgi:hypothetical protein
MPSDGDGSADLTDYSDEQPQVRAYLFEVSRWSVFDSGTERRIVDWNTRVTFDKPDSEDWKSNKIPEGNQEHRLRNITPLTYGTYNGVAAWEYEYQSRHYDRKSGLSEKEPKESPRLLRKQPLTPLESGEND